MLVIVDYKTGNVGSLLNMLGKIGVQACLSDRQEDILAATRLILPGVGAFDNGMNKLRKSGLISCMESAVFEKQIPILGICLGMQLFSLGSEEGQEEGLGWIAAQTVKFRWEDVALQQRIPHMGWNSLSVKKAHLLFKEIDEKSMFYFVHSYHMQCADEKDVQATSHYGSDFCAVVGRNNIIGTQFHPEKSLRYGMTLLKNFCSEAVS